ncbi:MAG: nitrogenase molybdenum-iron protein subunit beta [Thermodesulfovibrionales bacterium]|nr:nitrogenase molybdenum-iron protein subunit beta [Thermodesulfovibrionales bacterium]
MKKLRIIDHIELFKNQEYTEQFVRKREFEKPSPDQEVERVLEWTKTEEYKDKNFAREALTINPAKACQPLGAVLCALGFEGTLPFVHGSQGCVAYFRSHFSRHFKEPVAAVSTSMTEDAAVFGGLNNMIEGLENAYRIYKPKMIAVSTTCMAEVIGDDLNAFIKKAKDQGVIPADLPVPFAHTPSFVGSHINGYDNMMKGILSYLTEGVKRNPNKKINIIPGFDTYTGNYREIKRLLTLMNVEHTVLADVGDVLDSPNTGEYRMYPGGTSLKDAADSINSIQTIALQKFSTQKTGEFIREVWNQEFQAIPAPIGIKNTDRFLELVSHVTGKSIPQEIEDERGRAIDAMVDSYQYIYGKRFALVGDPDLLLGLISFLMEMGGIPVHILCTNGDKDFEDEAYRVLSESPFGREGKVHAGKDMWHLRSLLFLEPVDFLIGNSYAKFLWRDTGTPLIRIGFPIFDRHHLHRYPIIGYKGAINLLNWIVNTVLDEMDRKTINTTSFDVIR